MQHKRHKVGLLVNNIETRMSASSIIEILSVRVRQAEASKPLWLLHFCLGSLS